MVIIIDKKYAALKKGTSFEYVSENRLFSDSDDYTLNISFPLKNCQQNLNIFGHINRMDKGYVDYVFDCEIRDRDFVKKGSIVITEISDLEVKCQFLEGRSAQNFNNSFDNVYINELDLGDPGDTNPKNVPPVIVHNANYLDYTFVALPWVNNNSDSGLPQNFVKKESVSVYGYEWAYPERNLSFQPFLIYIIKNICKAVGYSYNLGELESNPKYYMLLICNALPGSWNMPEFASALPHWSVSEFFQKLESFLGGFFTFDHMNKVISFQFNSNLLKDVKNVNIDKVIDEHSTALDINAESDMYKPYKNIRYRRDDSNPWKYYSCNWFIDQRKKKAKSYANLSTLISENKAIVDNWWENVWLQQISEINRLFYASDFGRYFLISGEGYKEEFKDGLWQNKVAAILHPLNEFAPKIVDPDNDNFEELDFVPVGIGYSDGEFGQCMFLDFASYSENEVLDDYSVWTDKDTGVNASLLSGSSDSEDNEAKQYFDKIYLAYWASDLRFTQMPCPWVSSVVIKDDWSGYIRTSGNLSLQNNNWSYETEFNIDYKAKYSFKFISDTLPDVKAIFYIRGKRYVCVKLTATFSEKGMSNLIKGEFYRIADY